MKKLVAVLIAIMTIAALFVSSPITSAMSISGPNGTQSGGWFKDSFTVAIAHGTTTCVGSGTAYQYTYTSTNTGTHTYAFYSDAVDNPYVSVDGSGYMPLDMRCPPAPPLSLVKQFTASIDSQPPGVSITSPIGTVTTSSNSYTVSGFAGDPEGNLTSVQAFINNSAGPKASISGSTFSVNVPLSNGTNNVWVVASDIVGHSTTSNTVTINTSGGTSGSGGGGSTSGGGSSGSSSSSSSSPTNTASTTNSSSSPSSSSSGSKSQAVKFGSQQLLNLTDPYADDKTSDPTQVQATAALAGATGKTYDALITSIIILFSLCVFVLYRFRPIFAELDRDKSGLRRRIIVIVTLPSLIPLLGLGFVGYQQLSNSTRASLSSQLEKAAQTSALKLDREFSIRRLVISKTASDILQIKSQYQTQQQQLSQQKNNCQQVVQANIPTKQYAKVTSNDDCLPFLTGFAQLASSSSATVNDYLNALTQGANQASQDLASQENQRVNELLGSIRDFFPDVLELDVVNKDGSIQAILPRTDSKQRTILQTHKNLLSLSSGGNLALLDQSKNTHQLLLTYPIINGKNAIGGAVVALDTEGQRFVPTIWSATPKPYSSDQTYFVTTAGEVVTPPSVNHQLQSQSKSLANTSSGKVYSLKLAKQVYATRTAPVINTNWVVAVGAPASSILAPLAGIQRTALLAIGGFILLSVLLGIWFVSSIAGEIERLFQGALAFAKGNLDYRIGLKSHDELQVLGDTMDKMATDIKAAEAALVEKDKEFINIATHELKAPMTAIIGNLSMVTEGMGTVDETARDLIGEAYKGTVRLRDLVTDMLDVARLESGHAEFELAPQDIGAITKAVVDMQAVPAQQASVRLSYAPSPIPNVIADKNKLQIIITNFVSNAIKYNRQGGTITISHDLDGNNLVTAITDTGLGIPEEQQSHIFEKFYRVKNEDRANVPGTGLGMYITKQFIENMKGKVWFKSVHGQGTTFYFSLPLAISVAPKPAPAATETVPAPGLLRSA